jgi:hypothetical protein
MQLKAPEACLIHHLDLAFRKPVIEIVAQHFISSWHTCFMNNYAPAPNAQLPRFLGVLEPHKDFFVLQDTLALVLHRRLPPLF